MKSMKHCFSSGILIALMISITTNVFGQVGINDTDAIPDPSAMLDVSSTEKGILIPRMSKAQKDAIVSPAQGLVIYQDEALDSLLYFDGVSWQLLSDVLKGSVFNEPRDDYYIGPFDDAIIYDHLGVGGTILHSEEFLNGATIILRDSVIEIEFDDTSTSASFPNNHWRLKFNDSDATTNGRNVFMILDDFPGPTTEVFSIEANAGDHAFYIDSMGNVGFGTNTPSDTLHVEGNAIADTISHTGSITALSDVRLKKQITEYNDGLNEISKLNPVQYDLLTNGKVGAVSHHYGLLAQDVQEIFPQAVGSFEYGDGEDKTQYLSVSYMHLVTPILQSIQTQQETLSQMDVELKSLNDEYQKLAKSIKEKEHLIDLFFNEDGTINEAFLNHLVQSKSDNND